ncbi:hypothetical protein SEA_FIZZLES_99 [Microbacterium phage Fizzles]|nr:hypothetical protein SEA_FIZZLES_99 [Microbacterium phage Fizzles]
MVTNAPLTNVGVVDEGTANAHPVSDTTPIDVWLRWNGDGVDENGDDELADYEANTFRTEDGFRVDWYLNAVGLVTSVDFATYSAAQEWLTANDYQDFTS